MGLIMTFLYMHAMYSDHVYLPITVAYSLWRKEFIY